MTRAYGWYQDSDDTVVDHDKAKAAVNISIDQSKLIESIDIDAIYLAAVKKYKLIVTQHVEDDLDALFHRKRNSKENNGVGYEFLREHVDTFISSDALKREAISIITDEFHKILRQKTLDVLTARAGKLANGFMDAIHADKITPQEMRAMIAALRMERGKT